MFASATKKNSDVRRSEPPVEVPIYNQDEKNTYNGQSQQQSMSNNNTNASTFFSQDAELKGSLYFTNKLEFNGKFEGEVIADGPLIIGEKALIKGDINAASSVVIYGKVKGNITAKEQIELKGMAHLYGDVKASRFIVSEGATFVGRSDTLEGKGPAEDFNNMFTRLGSVTKKSSIEEI